MDATATFGTLNCGVLAVYLGALVIIGVWVGRRQKNAEEYFLAGRSMPWLVVGMSIFASVTSAVSYMGFPGTVASENLSVLVGYSASPLAAPFILLLFYPLYHALGVTTSYEYVYRRYGSGARYAVSGLFILARLGWLGVVVYAPALALSVATGMNLYATILAMGLLATLYTTAGGLRAVLLTDVFQFLILTTGTVWVAVCLVYDVPGGIAGIYEAASQSGHLVEWRFSWAEAGGLVLGVSYFLSFTQDYGTDQVTVQRLLSSKGYGGMVRAILFNSLFDVIFFSLLAFIGLGLYAYFQQFPQEPLSGDRMLPRYIMEALPNGISGLLVAGIFAAAMSSLDSGIHSVSTVVVNDYVRPLRHHPLSERGSVALARGLTVSIGLFATAFAFYVSSVEQILKASNTFLGLFNGPVLALFVLGVLSRGTHFAGWLCGAVIGIAATVIIMNLPVGGQSLHWAFYMPCSFGTTAVVGYVASRLLPGAPADGDFTIWRWREAAGRARQSELTEDNRL